ncbi:hypothetical protein [Chryseobacterium sp. MFBS3-17]|uniref:hypothetical protein n=1 Tax=Chryseobacterium sp. MFBS3-17 TaxID=2886689 RepID=UPI001D0E86EC|nr:hypothetical protein [Chryseobacterium sp. MFBS3-17]MCC2591694.1 hypothetical protein [Chryseobacterium sp. MFBS3-17]
MKKIIFFILSFFSMLCVHAQNDFPYFREWGTYIGGAGTKIANEYKGNVFPVDSQGNMFVGGVVDKVAGYTTSYYDQFVLNGSFTHTESYLDG